MNEMDGKYCPRKDMKLISLVAVIGFFGITLWGVVVTIIYLYQGWYEGFGDAIKIGDIIVLIFSVIGLIFFGILIYFFSRCKNSAEKYE